MTWVNRSPCMDCPEGWEETVDSSICPCKTFSKWREDDPRGKKKEKANHMNTTIVFEDKGQDFLEWDLDENNEVVACRPAQGWVWIGSKVMNKVIKVGGKIRFKSKHMRCAGTLGSLSLNYKVIDIKEV